jgi:hypothetical protein
LGKIRKKEEKEAKLRGKGSKRKYKMTTANKRIKFLVVGPVLQGLTFGRIRIRNYCLDPDLKKRDYRAYPNISSKEQVST